MGDPGSKAGFLGRLAGDERLGDESIAVVVAHPDDETLGLGAQLGRMPGVTIVHVTDGAPRSGPDTTRRGFASAEDYARARWLELERAMAVQDVPVDALVGLGVADQDACNNLAPLTRRLADLIEERGFKVILTHSYEGGHPDHDATAFAVAEAARRLGERAPLVVEMPFYRSGPDGLLPQSFPPDPAAPALTLWLTDKERDRKRRMYEAHASQAEVLAGFPIAVERFRVAPVHDFDALPNGGALHYERYDWGLTGERWLTLVAEARAASSEVAP